MSNNRNHNYNKHNNNKRRVAFDDDRSSARQSGGRVAAGALAAGAPAAQKQQHQQQQEAQKNPNLNLEVHLHSANPNATVLGGTKSYQQHDLQGATPEQRSYADTLSAGQRRQSDTMKNWSHDSSNSRIEQTRPSQHDAEYLPGSHKIRNDTTQRFDHEIHVNFYIAGGQANTNPLHLHMGSSESGLKKIDLVRWSEVSGTEKFSHFKCIAEVANFSEMSTVVYKISSTSWGIIKDSTITIARGSAVLSEVRCKDAKIVHLFAWPELQEETTTAWRNALDWLISGTNKKLSWCDLQEEVIWTSFEWLAASGTHQELCGFIGCLRRLVLSNRALMDHSFSIHRCRRFCESSDKSEMERRVFIIVTVLGFVDKNSWNHNSRFRFRENFLCDPVFPSTILLNNLPNAGFIRNESFPKLMAEEFYFGLISMLKHNVGMTSHLYWVVFVTNLDDSYLASNISASLREVQVCPFSEDGEIDNYILVYEDIVTSIDWNAINMQFLNKILERAPNNKAVVRFLSHLITLDSILFSRDIFVQVLQKFIQSLDGLVIIVDKLYTNMVSTEYATSHHENRIKAITRFLDVLTNRFQQLIILERISLMEVKSLSYEELSKFSIDNGFLENLLNGLLRSQSVTLAKSCLNYFFHTNLVFFITFQSSFVVKACVQWLDSRNERLINKVDESRIVVIFEDSLALLQILSNAIEFVRFDSIVGNQLASTVPELIKYLDEKMLGGLSDIFWFKAIKLLSSLLFRNESIFSIAELQQLALNRIQRSLQLYFESHGFDEKDAICVLDLIDSPLPCEDRTDLSRNIFFKNVISSYLKMVEKSLSKEKVAFSELAPFHKLFRRLFVENEHNISYYIVADSSILFLKLHWVRDNFVLPILSGDITVKEFLLLEDESKKVETQWKDVIVNFSLCVGKQISSDLLDEYLKRIRDFDEMVRKLESFANFLFSCLPSTSAFLQELTEATNELAEITQKRLDYSLSSVNEVWTGLLSQLSFYAHEYCDKSRSKVFTSILKNSFSHFHDQQNDVNGDENEDGVELEENDSFQEFCEKSTLKASRDFIEFLLKLKDIENVKLYEICDIWKEDFVFENEYEALQGIVLPDIDSLGIYRNARIPLINLSKLPVLKRHAGYYLKAREIMMNIAGVREAHKCLSKQEQNKLEVFERLSNVEFAPSFDITVSDASAVVGMWLDDVEHCVGSDAYDSMMGILEELSQCQDLVEFIKELREDSVINFMDMIEEHSESAIRAETITEFDTVRRFLMLSMNNQRWSPLKWLEDLHQCGMHPTVGGIDKLPGKLHTCRLQCYALRDVFHSVAKREESTKKLVKKMLASGHICWCRTENSNFRIIFTFQSNGLDENRDQSSIEELRSRALLLVNSTSKLTNMSQEEQEEFASEKDQLELFILLTNQILDISWLLNELILLGHFAVNMPLLETEFRSEPLTLMQNRYQTLKDDWAAALVKLRRNFHYMNYFFSDQIWTIYDFMRGKTTDYSLEDRKKAIGLMRFLFGGNSRWGDEKGIEMFFVDVDLNICRQKAIALLQFVDKSKSMVDFMELEGSCEELLIEENDYTSNLEILAQNLEAFFAGYDYECVHVDGDDIQYFYENNHHDSLMYSVYDSDASLFPTLFGAIHKHGGSFVRNQLLICEDKTTVEEYVAFFQRALANTPGNQSLSELYVVINLHVLSSNNRSLVFKALNFAKANQSKHCKNLLVFLVRSELTAYVEGTKQLRKKQVSPLSFDAISKMVQSRSPNVTVVTSLETGMGKTERCFQIANAGNLRLQEVLVSDNISRKTLAREIDEVATGIESSNESDLCLHLNISNPNHMVGVELALFELFFLGMSQFGTSVVNWPSQQFCLIEITNLASRKNQMDILQYFKREEITWSMDKFVVDEDLTSNTQLVCNYLHLLESDQLHQREILLPNPTMDVLPPDECRRLLIKYFLQKHSVSVNVLQIFLSVFASQLREFSASGHFQLTAFEFSGSDPRQRTYIVQTLLECASDFATKSIQQVKFAQSLHTSANTAVDMNDLADDERAGILRWEDDNQLMLAIADGTLTLLYRNLSQVTPNMKAWIQSQRGELPDYFKLSTGDLRAKLSEFCGLREKFTGKPHYVLTPDNFLKITMMLIRVQAGIPVIIMGEAGCGKTSLIRFAGAVAGATVKALSIHAGITRKHLETFLTQCIQRHENESAISSSPLWIFLDEINTCDELGFLNSVICHRYLPGIRIPNNVHFFAACNPFKRLNKGHLENSIGLHAAKAAHLTDHLVYRVKPLPSRMMDFIWDFGSLTEYDEYLYIEEYWANNSEGHQVTIDSVPLHSKLVSASQSFIRCYYGRSAVSMRDVRRVNLLYHWFRRNKHTSKLGGYWCKIESHAAIILSLAHCYRCRLPDVKLRKEYCEVLSDIFRTEKIYDISSELIQDRIVFEQEAYIRAMDTGIGIAMNVSLTENVFILLVCILNRIPVFLVGKPGSSKSLAMTLITSNLRGKDSTNEFFKNLPEVKVISFQGSESSTSDGINKIFKKAEDLVEAAKLDAEADSHRCRNQVIPLVLLDEVGLAEISPHNPLKVLHAKLETEDDTLLDIAVVGISNWSLDASKMSRAIQLSRPEPDQNELFHTAVKIITSILNKEHLQDNLLRQLRMVSNSFFDFYNQQKSSKYANFHGLRDFYSLCKHMGFSYRDSSIIIYPVSILRNFGGIPTRWETSAFKNWFPDRRDFAGVGVNMIEQNLRDPASRYLMVITKGDSILNAIGSFLQNAGISEYRVVIGSKFKEDDSEKYRYQMLSEIILSMEKGESLILVDLESIYGSLYDMSNQNFTYIAGKKHCRVALGAYSNPMAHVHDKFKCVVVVDAAKAYSLDPPFLNRFEKQQCDFTSLLSVNCNKIVEKCQLWLKKLCTLHISGGNNDGSNEFTVRDTFIGYAGEDTISSLAFSIISNTSKEYTAEEVSRIIMKKLVKLLTFPGLIRIMQSVRAIENPQEVQEICGLYFSDYSKINLQLYLRNLMSLPASSQVMSQKSIITTFTQFFDIASNLSSFVPPEILSNKQNKITVEKMALMGSQRTLASTIHEFYRETNPSNVYILQCDVQEDLNKLLMTKFLIDQEHALYQKRGLTTLAKHAIVIFSVSPELYEEDVAVGFNTYFSRDWEHTHIDNLEEDERHWQEVVQLIHNKKPFADFLSSHANVVMQIFEDNLMSFLSMLTYRYLPSTDYFQQCCEQIRSNTSFKTLLYEKIVRTLLQAEQQEIQYRGFWLFEIARNREFLYFSPSFYQAIHLYVKDKIKLPSILSIYVLERCSALQTFSSVDPVPEMWQTLYLNSMKFDLKPLVELHAKSAELSFEIPQLRSKLHFPFTFLLFNNIEDTVKSSFLEEMENVDSKNKDPLSIMQSFHHRILEQQVKPFFSDGGVNFNDIDLNHPVEDIICLFVRPHVYTQHLSAACRITHVLLASFSNQSIENVDSIMVQLMLWYLSKPLVMAVKLLMFRRNFDNNEVDSVEVLGNVEELFKKYHLTLDNVAQGNGKGLGSLSFGVRLQMAELIINFSERAYPFLSKSNQGVIANETEDMIIQEDEDDEDIKNEHLMAVDDGKGLSFTETISDAVKSESLISWADSLEALFPVLLTFCKECRLDYLQFDVSAADCMQMIFVYQEMVPRLVGLRILIDLGDLMRSTSSHLSPEQSGLLAEVMSTYLRIEKYEGFRKDMLHSLLNMLQECVERGILPDQEVTQCTFKILERYLLISMVDQAVEVMIDGVADVSDERFKQVMDQQLLKREDYQIIANIIVMHQSDPPLACHPMLIHLVEKVITTIVQEEIAEDLPCFGSLDEFSEFMNNHLVLQAFESLLGKEGIKDSLLEVVMIDITLEVLKRCVLEEDTFENDFESFCETFEKLMLAWSKGMENISLVERIYGAAFLKFFIDEAHACDAIGKISIIVTIQETLNRVFDHNPWASVHSAVAMYWLKLFKKPFSELRVLCGEGSVLSQQYPWLQKLNWNPDGEHLLTNLMPFIDITDETRQSCEISWNEVFDPLSPSNARLEDLVSTMPINELLMVLIIVAFKKQCRTAQTLHQVEIAKITKLLPSNADPTILKLFNHVYTRFAEVIKKDWSLDDVCIFLVLISFLSTSNGIIGKDTLFGKYLHEVETCRSSFVLGANSDYVSSVIKHLQESQYSYFKCACGYVFVIDNCRRPMERRPCPNCNLSLGGHDHAFDATGQTPYQPLGQDKLGYNYLMDSLNVVSHCERRLSPNEYRIIAFFVHCSILGGLLLHPEEYSTLLAQTLADRNYNSTALEYCWTQLTNHWDVLRKRLVDDGRSELLCGFMIEVSRLMQGYSVNAVPMHSNDRDVMEEQIAGLFRPALEKFVDTATAAVAKYTDSTHVPSPFENALEERDQPNNFLGRYLRICKPPSFESLEQSFLDMHDGKERFPIVAIFFKFQEKLDRIQWMLPIIEWTNHVRKVLNYQINADDAKSHSVKQIAANQPLLNMTLYRKFMEAWNHFYEFNPVLEYNREMFEMFQNPDCHEVVLPEALSEESSMLYSCIRVKRYGRETAYLLHQLAELQNQFLREMLPLAKLHHGAPEKFMQNITSEHRQDIIDFDVNMFWKDTARYVRTDMRYGHGRQLDCDWMKIEQLIIQRLINGKSFFKSNIWQSNVLEEFRFKDELFQEQYRLFDHVREIVPQDRILPHYRNVVHDPRVRDQSFLQDRLLPALQSLLYVLQHQPPQASKLLSDYTIADFSKKYLDRSTNLIFAELQERNSEIVKTPLKQVEILYEVLEDHISDAVLGCVSNEYYSPLSEYQSTLIKRKLLKLVDYKEEELESCLRRFMIRYLRGTHGLSPFGTFADILDMIRWPKDIDMTSQYDEDGELRELFDSLQIGHIGSIHKLLHDLLEVKREREAVKQSLYQHNATPTSQFPSSYPAADGESEDGGGQNKNRRRRVMKNVSAFSSV